jgi:hypothetical protein
MDEIHESDNMSLLESFRTDTRHIILICEILYVTVQYATKGILKHILCAISIYI